MAAEGPGRPGLIYLGASGLVCEPCAWVVAYMTGVRLELAQLDPSTVDWACERCHARYFRRGTRARGLTS